MHCRHSVELPALSVELASRTARGQEDLRAADALWKIMPAPRTRALAWGVGFGLGGMVFGSMASWALLVRTHGHPGRSFVFFVVMPVLSVLVLLLDWAAAGAPFARIEHSLQASFDPRFPEICLCRRCMAPITLEPHCLFARCTYCSAHNLVRNPKPAAYRYSAAVSEAGKEQLADAIAAARTIHGQRRLVRAMAGCMSAAIVLTLALALWNQ